MVPENDTFLDDIRSLCMWNLLPQEVAYDKVNRFKEDIESLRDVTGDVHISTTLSSSKAQSPMAV